MLSSADARTRTVEHTGAIVDGANRCRPGSGSTTNTERASAAQAHTAQLCCRGSSRSLRHSRTHRVALNAAPEESVALQLSPWVCLRQHKRRQSSSVRLAHVQRGTRRVVSRPSTAQEKTAAAAGERRLLCVRCWPAPCSSCPLLLFAALAAGRSPPGACGWAQSSAELFSSALVKGGEAS